MDQCGIIPPRPYDMVGWSYKGDTARLGCILEGVHNYGPHVFSTSGGKYYAWEDDLDCDCCSPDEEDRCCIYWEIKKAELEKYQNGGR